MIAQPAWRSYIPARATIRLPFLTCTRGSRCQHPSSYKASSPLPSRLHSMVSVTCLCNTSIVPLPLRSSPLAPPDRVARRFYHTRSFFYRIKQGSPASSSSRTKQPKLYTTLREVASHTSEGNVLFPNLDEASFEQVPQVIDNTGWPSKPTFLSNIKIIHLEHSPLSLYDCPPDFSILGMRDVREVHMYHLAGCEISHESLLRTHMDYQGFLEKVHFHLSGHFENTVCSDQHTSRVHTLVNGILQPTGATRIRRSFDTTIYINEYAAAVSKLASSVAYAQITGASRPHPVYPSLKQVVIDVGGDRESSPPQTSSALQSHHGALEECTDRQLMVKRCKSELLRYRERAEQRLTQASHSPVQTIATLALPEILVVQGKQDPVWRLDGTKPTS